MVFKTLLLALSEVRRRARQYAHETTRPWPESGQAAHAQGCVPGRDEPGRAVV